MSEPTFTHQRLYDLVRSQRSELFHDDLINEEEYAALASGGGQPPNGSVGRLEDYDQMRKKLNKYVTDLERVEKELALAQKSIAEGLQFRIDVGAAIEGKLAATDDAHRLAHGVRKLQQKVGYQLRALALPCDHPTNAGSACDCCQRRWLYEREPTLIDDKMKDLNGEIAKLKLDLTNCAEKVFAGERDAHSRTRRFQEDQEALKDRLEKEGDRRVIAAQVAGNGLYGAIVDALKVYFPPDTRVLEWDVLPDTLKTLVQELHRAKPGWLVTPKKKATGVKNKRLLLWLHMVSEHAGIFHPFDTLESLEDLHLHDHKEGIDPIGGPNDRTYHIHKVGEVLAEAENPDSNYDHEGPAK